MKKIAEQEQKAEIQNIYPAENRSWSSCGRMPSLKPELGGRNQQDCGAASNQQIEHEIRAWCGLLHTCGLYAELYFCDGQSFNFSGFVSSLFCKLLIISLDFDNYTTD